MSVDIPASQTSSDDDLLALDRQVCFALAVANRAVLAVYRPILEPLGLTHPQYLVMLVLWERAPLAVKDIGALLQLDSPTLSPLLKRLEALGLITRTRSSVDERRLVVGLTDTGHDLRTAAKSVPQQVVDALGVEMSELEELHRVLGRVNAAAQKQQQSQR